MRKIKSKILSKKAQDTFYALANINAKPSIFETKKIDIHKRCPKSKVDMASFYAYLKHEKNPLVLSNFHDKLVCSTAFVSTKIFICSDKNLKKFRELVYASKLNWFY